MYFVGKQCSGETMNVSGSPANQHYRAFLSHNGAEKASVEALAAELERRGISCWLDKWNLIPGEAWQPAIEQALSQCDNCLVLFGPHGLGRGTTRKCASPFKDVPSQERANFVCCQ